MSDKYDMLEQEFWLHYMVEHHVQAKKTWKWAWFVDSQGQIHVRDGAIWLDTGVYCKKRVIRGCEWE